MFGASSLLFFSCFTKYVEGSSTWISDERVRDLNSAPVLGRGYSIRSNTYRSNCLVVGGISVPSFNYHYQFIYISPEPDASEDVEAIVNEQSDLVKMTYYAIKRKRKQKEIYAKQIESSEDGEDVVDSKQEYNLVASMRVDRYYSSIQENEAQFSKDALELLENEDYVEFFKSCGIGFVRSIRRIQEVVINFSWSSADTAAGREFAQSIERYSSGQSYENVFTAPDGGDEMNSLVVKIQARGIGLSPLKDKNLAKIDADEADSLVITDLSKFNSIMQFAYKRMTRDVGENSDQTGQVHSIEIVPWTNNPTFQIASKVYDHIIYSPVPFNEIPSVTPGGVCRSEDHSPDSYRKCCLDQDKHIVTLPDQEVSKVYCKPKRLLSTSMMKNNMEQNGEFVTIMSTANRKNFELQDRLHQCVHDLHQMDPSHDYKYLKSSSSYSLNVDHLVTVKELKMFLDPTADSALHKLIAREFSEHRGMFYDRCLGSLYVDEDGDGSEKGPKYFMSQPYYEHETCAFPTCSYAGMRWDRDSQSGGCVDSTIKNGPLYQPKRTHYDDDSGGPPNCLLIFDPSEPDGIKCKYDQGELYDIRDTFQSCWENLPGKSDVSPLYLMERFCGLELEGSEADVTRRKQVDEMARSCPGWSDNLSDLIDAIISCLIPVDLDPTSKDNNIIKNQFVKVLKLASADPKKTKGSPIEFILAGFDHPSMSGEKHLFRLVSGTASYEKAKKLISTITRSNWASLDLSSNQMSKIEQRSSLDVLVKSCRASFDGKENWNIVKELLANTPQALLKFMLTMTDFDSGATCLHYATKSKDLALFLSIYNANTANMDVYDKQKQSVIHYAAKFSGRDINSWIKDNLLQNVAYKKTATQSSTIDDDPSFFRKDYACVASMAVDGNTVGHHDDPCTVSHTDMELNPWWQVDLHNSFDINMIRVYNRADTKFDELKNFKVRVLKELKDGSTRLVWESEEQITAPSPFVVLIPPLGTNGNVIKISVVHQEERQLVMSQVQVWSYKSK